MMYVVVLNGPTLREIPVEAASKLEAASQALKTIEKEGGNPNEYRVLTTNPVPSADSYPQYDDD